MSWRDLQINDRLEFMAFVQDGLTKRQIFGHETHGDTFKGDPIQHAIEEAFDLIFYLWEIQRERKEREAKLIYAVHDLGGKSLAPLGKTTDVDGLVDALNGLDIPIVGQNDVHSFPDVMFP